MRKKLIWVLLILMVMLGASFRLAQPAKAQDSFFDRLNDAVVNAYTAAGDTNQELVKQVEGVAATNPNSGKSVGNNNGHFMADIMLRIVGAEEVVEQPGVTFTEEQKQIAYQTYGRGAIGDLGGAIAWMYTPPANTQTYVADLMKSAHIVPPAYAQGLGFAALDPILETWKVFRNVAYLFFVGIFLIIGFMIMFRHKISGQTVVTAQQAIPHIIVALLFVTFSYAIAGLMIDIMYLVMYLLIGLFQGDTQLIDMHIFSLAEQLISGGSGPSVFNSTKRAVEHLVQSALAGPVGDVIGWLSGVTVGLIVSIAVLIGVFKLFFELLKTYIAIILNIAFAPLALMMGALPGKNTFWSWARGIMGNLAAFPTVLMILIMHRKMVETELTTGGFLPPYMLGRGNGSVIVSLVGIGIILVIPEIVKKVKEAMGAKEGVFGELMQGAIAQTKEGLPLGGRIAGTGIGGVAGGAVGGLRGGIGALVPATAPGLSMSRRLSKIGRGVAGGVYRGVKVGVDEQGRPIMSGGIKQGASKGAGMAAKTSRYVGADQPDAFNLITDRLDKKLLTEEERKKQEQQQTMEDVYDRLKESLRQ
ncbi:MAG: hypothetical protein GF390_02165 [Candidatus Pacebacteria bacterium]|nr:hypothetical protein [Candidatus Paceibacterota bacterium]